MKIWLWITGILAIAASYFKDRLQAAKIKELKRDKAEDKAAYESFLKADEALSKGLQNEADTSDNSTYFTK